MEKFKKSLIYLYRANEITRLIVTGGAFLLGEIALFIIMALSRESEYAALGRFLGKLAFYFTSLFIVVGSCTQDYKDLIRLGVSRRTSLLAVTTASLIVPAVMELGFILLAKLERLLMKLCFGATDEIELINFTDGKLWYVGFMIILAAFLLGIIAAVCINKYGHTGLMVVYFVYMFMFVILPTAVSKLINLPPLNAAADVISANPLLTAAALGAVAIIAMYFMLRSVYKTAV